MEIIPGVHRVEGVSGSNVVLLIDEKMGVIDTGIAGNGEAIVSYIKKIGRNPKDLEYIVMTHFHGDHSGSASELRALTGAKIVAHKGDTQTKNGALLLRKGNDSDQQPPIWVRMLTGAVRGRRPRNMAPMKDTTVDVTVEEGSVLPRLTKLKIIDAPGHTPGSICPVFEGSQKVLFLGDSAINNINRLSRPLTWDGNNRKQLDASLRKLRTLDAQVAMFGHGPPLTESVMDKVRGMTDRPYSMPTWMILLKNYKLLQQWRATTKKPGHWSGSEKAAH